MTAPGEQRDAGQHAEHAQVGESLDTALHAHRVMLVQAGLQARAELPGLVMTDRTLHDHDDNA